MTDRDKSIREIFLEESKEIMDLLESDIVRLEDGFDAEILNTIFRGIHTLKGSSGVAGFTEVYEFTHQLENLLDLVRSGSLEPDADIVGLLLQSLDWTKLAIFGGEKQEQVGDLKDFLLNKITDYISGAGSDSADSADSAESEKEPAEAPDYRYFRIGADFREDIFERGIDPLSIMEEVYSHGSEVSRKVRRNLPEFQEMDPERCYVGWEIVLKTKHTQKDIEDIFLFVQDDNDIVIEDVTDEFIVADEEWLLREKRVGEILLSKGIITEEELNKVLKMQELQNVKLGDLVVEKGFADLSDVQYALEEQEIIKTKIETSTVRVAAARLDNLMNLLGEIVIGQSAISRIAEELEDEKSFRLKNALYGLDRTTREFQQQIMSIRMIPIGPTFEQFRRFVRDAAHTCGKEIRLDIEGRATELDKTVIEKISDPLKHMIRNALDHGIESPDERKAAGKNRAGTITLRAYHQEGNVYIEIADDGRGIDLNSVKKRAMAMGLLRAEEDVSDSRLLNYLFLPGFSTSEKIGDLSGRGVGMDVVKANVDALRGAVEIENTAGSGTIFRIKLPLTLAIIEGMLVRVGEQVYIIPLLSIVESIQPREEDVKTIKGKGEVVSIRGEYVSLVRLHEFFGVKSEYVNPWESLVVIVEAVGEQVGLMIDDLIGQQQVVIKNLDNYITYNRAVSGAAILGDGQVALIMDIHGLIGEITALTV